MPGHIVLDTDPVAFAVGIKAPAGRLRCQIVHSQDTQRQIAAD